MRALWIVVALAAPAAAAPDVANLSAGNGFTCAALVDGSVWCWGTNGEGQLGDGSTTDRSVPVRVTGIDDAVAVAADHHRACARRRDATVACWGVLAASSTVTRATAIPATDVVQVAGPCMRLRNGTATCFSARAQLVPVTDLANTVDIAAHRDAGCAVHGSGDVVCWSASDFIAHPIAHVTGATHVAIAGTLACALGKSGTVTCWDWGMHDERERVTMVESHRPPKPPERLPVRPARIAGVTGAIVLAGGDERVCAATTRDVRCWTHARQASVVPGLAAVKALAVSTHACALRGGRDVACWGPDTNGQLGNGWGRARTVPSPVPGITDVVELGTAFSPGTGDAQWSCARRRDDHMWCWGNTSPHNTPGGDPTPREMKLGAIKRITRGMVAGAIDSKDRWVLAGRGEVSVVKLPPLVDAAGDCGLAKDGRVLCTSEHRASNENLVGDGYVIPGLDDAVQIAVGGNPACARRRGGQVVCFEQRAFKVIKEVPDAIDLGAGTYTACAVRANRHVWCWGQNGSWLLYGDPLHQKSGDSPPIEIAGLADVAALSVGNDYACALKTDKTVWCWGDNGSGQLGDGTVVSRTRPARVPGLANVVQISAGTQHACALLADRTVTCWGESATGQIGTFATNDIATPAAVTW
jgi:alpha-tubulin suppressor-like RCC1 family protein